VPSPTYTLLQTYQTGLGFLWHFDLYRLKRPADVMELGWQDAEVGLMLIEWPQNAGAHLPSDRLDVTLTQDADGRRARLEPHGERWQERLHDF
jgi:tRNA threonylcarbamoyladenosine biosynthesis protein TsaE